LVARFERTSKRTCQWDEAVTELLLEQVDDGIGLADDVEEVQLGNGLAL